MYLYGEYDPEERPVLINAVALSEMMKFLQEFSYQTYDTESPKFETACMLIGHRRVDDMGREYTEVEGFLPVPKPVLDRMSRTVVSVEFNNEFYETSYKIFDKLNEILEADYQIVGWAHSHPDLGVFFSAADIRSQAHYDSSNGMALVYDPALRSGDPQFAVFSKFGKGDAQQGSGIRRHKGVFQVGESILPSRGFSTHDLLTIDQLVKIFKTVKLSASDVPTDDGPKNPELAINEGDLPTDPDDITISKAPFSRRLRAALDRVFG